MADPLVTFGFIGFFAALSGLLGLTFVAFTRMDRDVRRARMFIMEKRIQRILGSVIADSNGLTVASDVKGGVSSSVLSAMSTLIAQSGARVFENIQMHGPTFIIMDGDQANVAVVQFAEGDVSLLTLVDRSANLGV